MPLPDSLHLRSVRKAGLQMLLDITPTLIDTDSYSMNKRQVYPALRSLILLKKNPPYVLCSFLSEADHLQRTVLPGAHIQKRAPLPWSSKTENFSITIDHYNFQRCARFGAVAMNKLTRVLHACLSAGLYCPFPPCRPRLSPCSYGRGKLPAL